MNITTKLQTGMIIKNYKAMCELLGEKVKDGKSKRLQLSDWKRYFDYKKKGHKFIIGQIFDEVKEKIDNRKNNGKHISNSKYGTLMDNLIINDLVGKKELNVSFTGLFFYDIPLFTDNFRDIMNDYTAYAKEHSMSKGLVSTYSEKTRKIVKKCLETSLERLQKQNKLEWKINIMVKNYLGFHELADESLIRDIKLREEEIYERMDINHFALTNQKKNKEFKKEVCKRIDGIISYWKVYTVKPLVEFTEAEEDREELIQRFQNSIFESVKNKSYYNNSSVITKNNIKIKEHENKIKELEQELDNRDIELDHRQYIEEEINNLNHLIKKSESIVSFLKKDKNYPYRNLSHQENIKRLHKQVWELEEDKKESQKILEEEKEILPF